MNIFSRMDNLASVPGPLVIAAGVFDGMHYGHRAVLKAALDMAYDMGGSAVALTFDPHPSKILRPECSSRLLTSTPHKLALMREFGIQHVLVIPFDEQFAALEAEVFLRHLCSAACSIQKICIGQGWRFGQARLGDVKLLRTLGPTLGFETTEVSAVNIGDTLVSSTLIRHAVEAGNLDQAECLLGRRYSIFGTVRRGNGLGKQIGFPTANIAAHNEQFPPDGVYAVQTRIRNTFFPSVANIGTRPTISSVGERLCEVHLFDFSENLYEQEIETKFVQFLRPEKRFPDVKSLRDQIVCDIESACSIFGNPKTGRERVIDAG